MVVIVLRKRIFLVPPVAEQFRRSIKSCAVHKFVQQRVDFLTVLLVEAYRVGIIDEFAHDAGLTAVVKHVCEDIPFVVIIAPTLDDIVADVLCKRIGRSAF